MRISKSRALELIDEKIKQFQHILDTATYDTCYNSEYDEAYYGTKGLVEELFSEEETNKFSRSVSFPFVIIDERIDYDKELKEYKEHVLRCISRLKVYKERIQNFWTEPETVEPENINRLRGKIELPGKTSINIINNPQSYSEANSTATAEQNIDIRIDLKIDLPKIQSDFDNLRRLIAYSNPELKSEMDEIQDSLDEVSADNGKERLKKPFNRLRRFLAKLGDPDSDYNKIIAGTQKGAELAEKVLETFNKVAPLLGILALHGTH